MRTAEEVSAFEASLVEPDKARRSFMVECFAAGVPKSFWFCLAKDVSYNQEVFQKIVCRYASKRKTILRRGWGMALMGDNGSGKTMFASYLATQFLRRGTSVYYTRVPKLNEDFKRGFKDDVFAVRLNEALEAELLVLDELGKELNSDGYLGVRLEEILKERYDNAQPTIITSNLNWTALVKRYGASIESMLEGRYLKVALEAGDFRLKTKADMKKDMKL